MCPQPAKAKGDLHASGIRSAAGGKAGKAVAVRGKRGRKTPKTAFGITSVLRRYRVGAGVKEN
jgi:hypothetical protein